MLLADRGGRPEPYYSSQYLVKTSDGREAIRTRSSERGSCHLSRSRYVTVVRAAVVGFLEQRLRQLTLLLPKIAESTLSNVTFVGKVVYSLGRLLRHFYWWPTARSGVSFVVDALDETVTPEKTRQRLLSDMFQSTKPTTHQYKFPCDVARRP